MVYNCWSRYQLSVNTAENNNYRIYSIKRSGVYQIFSLFNAAFIQGRRLFWNHFFKIANNNNNKFIQYYHFVQVLPIKITITKSLKFNSYCKSFVNIM